MAWTSGGASCGMTEKDIYEELCVDVLSGEPDDCVDECESSDREIGNDICGRQPKRKKAAQLVYTDDSDSEVSDSDGSLVKDASVTWNKIDLPRSLEDFQGVAGITIAPDNYNYNKPRVGLRVRREEVRLPAMTTRTAREKSLLSERLVEIPRQG